MTKAVVLPTDLAACHAIIRDLAKRVTKLESERDAAEGIADAALETVDGYERRKQAAHKTRNEQLPAYLPRYEVILETPAATKTCPTHGERKLVGMDWQETLEFEPSKLVVRRTGIPKYACVKAPECGVVEAPRPVGLVEGNKYDASIAAQVMVAKYAYHTPVNRQQDIFAASGWIPARSPLLNLLEAAAQLIRPLLAHLREVVALGRKNSYDLLSTPRADAPPWAAAPADESCSSWPMFRR